MPPSLRTARSTRNARGFPSPSTTRSLVPLTSSTRPVHYPPFELQTPDASLTADEFAWLKGEWSRFKVRPFSKTARTIGEGFYSVPYNSEKNKPTLEEVTGKRRFDFFAYSFTMPDDKGDGATVWDIMWDHETGMVRTMSIFRSLGYEKSAPAGTFKSTPSLPHLAVNITGGKIGIQGFWVPYPAALELCTRFAHPIRAVLYPLFGPEIIRRAVSEGHELWKVWRLERRVVEECWAQLARVSGHRDGTVGEEEGRVDTPMASREESTVLTPIGTPVGTPEVRHWNDRAPKRAVHMDVCLERERDAAMAMVLMGQKEALGSRVERSASGLGPFRAW